MITHHWTFLICDSIKSRNQLAFLGHLRWFLYNEFQTMNNINNDKCIYSRNCWYILIILSPQLKVFCKIIDKCSPKSLKITYITIIWVFHSPHNRRILRSSNHAISTVLKTNLFIINIINKVFQAVLLQPHKRKLWIGVRGMCQRRCRNNLRK